ncbi:MAG TPA: SAM-dependent methyltransferase [Rhodospirillaceae bacterium]|nr:SAM-dependent methyltransferase [Alphaproteobacteria bacterium]OUT41680.1 MAG: hypothetical protein CBB62_04980 [Micavibrio sp. TMED2]HCI45805.1 SAM-dependent methyltransferase [Rhodospirillaceae bacterium]MAS46748.1 SAM-dependent methyltransferase [Alphaproteobacteria bacterium]MAX94843.1 SAM-dependent methyltransferase [Alphaproteobacteria bacterium]
MNSLPSHNTPCPACEHPGDDLGYWLYGLPVNSVRLHHDRDAARGVPTGDLALFGCPACGFVWNPRFDPALVAYDAGYESTQSFSGTYRRFLAEQAEALVAEYGLAGGTVLEIGCGQGEFLAALCEAGVARGIGYDPAAMRERCPAVEQGELIIHDQAFTGDTVLPPVDLVCCRNTLEHIPYVAGFVRAIRRALGDSTDVPVFFQLPSWERVAATGAFWDVYYEHCSYFTRASLTGLFARAGFVVERCGTIFNGQYLDLRARPGQTGAGTAGGTALDINVLDIAAILDQGQFWQQHFDTCRRNGTRTVLWGGGSKAVALLTSLDAGGTVLAAVDINPHKHGTFLPVTGHPVIAPAALTDLAFDEVLLMNGAYREEVAAQLAALGLDPVMRVFD